MQKSNKRKRVATGSLEASSNTLRNIMAKRLKILVVYAPGFANRTIGTQIVGVKHLQH